MTSQTKNSSSPSHLKVMRWTKKEKSSVIRSSISLISSTVYPVLKKGAGKEAAKKIDPKIAENPRWI